jgi:hypothetical protein
MNISGLLSMPNFEIGGAYWAGVVGYVSVMELLSGISKTTQFYAGMPDCQSGVS